MRVRPGMTGVAVAAMVGLATACSSSSTIGGSAVGSSTGGGPTGQNSTPSSTPTPFAGKTLQPGEVAQVAGTSGARMQPVSDGMIRSFGTTVKIVEIGTADTVDDTSTGESYRAAAGASLLAFTVTVGHDEGMDGIGDKVVADVNVDGTQRTLPEFFGRSGGSSSAGGTQVHYVLATARNKQTVDLELKASNVVQSFDLLRGKPKGDRPAALYRSTSGTTVHQEGISPVTYKVAVYDKDEAHQVTVTRAELGYFTVKDAAAPSNPADGWLVLNVTDRSDGYATCVTPASAYTLKDAAGKEYKPSGAATSVPSEPGFVTDTESVVGFEVPADFAQGTLTIAPSTAVCEKGTMNFVPRPVHSTATVSISLPTA
ncbi:MAG: hypothetical protein HOV83_05585 [Catenulispora sp.]|nr:hypothetical protein [Catenulispora sp.]